MIDLAQVDTEMDRQENDRNRLTDKPDPVPNPWPAEIKTSAKQNPTIHHTLTFERLRSKTIRSGEDTKLAHMYLYIRTYV